MLDYNSKCLNQNARERNEYKDFYIWSSDVLISQFGENYMFFYRNTSVHVISFKLGYLEKNYNNIMASALNKSINSSKNWWIKNKPPQVHKFIPTTSERQQNIFYLGL